MLRLFINSILLLGACCFQKELLANHAPSSVFEKAEQVLCNEAADWRLEVELNHADGVYHIGDSLSISVLSPKKCYLHIFNLSPDGSLNLIWPPDPSVSNLIESGQPTQFPSSQAGLMAGIKAAEPVGEELLVFFATTAKIEIEHVLDEKRSVKPTRSTADKPLELLKIVRESIAKSSLTRNDWNGLGKVVKTIQKTGSSFAKAVELFNSGDLDGALPLLSKEIQEAPENQDAYYKRAAIFASRANFDEAILDYSTLISIDPKAAMAYSYRGRLWYHKLDFERAISDLSAALALNNELSDAYLYRCLAMQTQPLANKVSDENMIWADLLAGQILSIADPKRLAEKDLAQNLKANLRRLGGLEIFISVPYSEGSTSIRLYVKPPQKASHLEPSWEFYEVTSESNWNKVVEEIVECSASIREVTEWQTESHEYFGFHRGFRLVLETSTSRSINLGRGKSLRLTSDVLDHFRIDSESKYPSDRTAIIISEAHNELDQQIESYRGLQALLQANSWMKEENAAAFLVEAFESNKPLSLELLKRSSPNPNETRVFNSLQTALIPSYVAIEWSQNLGIPLIGHEDMQIYKLCNYLHWVIGTGKWSGTEAVQAFSMMGTSVAARNDSSGKTLIQALDRFVCPILFIGYGHIGPNSYVDDPKASFDKAFEEKTLKRLIPTAPTAWIGSASRKSIAHQLEKAGIGYVVLVPKGNFLMEPALRERHECEYLSLRKAQSEGEYSQYLQTIQASASRNCTTSPDPDLLARILPSLSDSFPNAEQYGSTDKSGLGQLLAECGTHLGCFPAGTLVQTANGLKAIESLQVGDQVYSFDSKMLQWKLEKIETVLTHEFQGDFIDLECENEIVSATWNHPFWVSSGLDLELRPSASGIPASESEVTQSGRWVNAGDILIGDILLSKSHRSIQVNSTNRIAGTETVYNLRIANLANFAVGGVGVLVHNDCSRIPANLFRDPDFGKNLKRDYSARNSLIPFSQCAAHHLIPVAEAQQSEVMKRAARLGYNINGANNGMFLPTNHGAAKAMKLPLHAGPHQAYSDHVAEKLAALDNKYKQLTDKNKRPNEAWIKNQVSKLEKQLRTNLHKNGYKHGDFDLAD